MKHHVIVSKDNTLVKYLKGLRDKPSLRGEEGTFIAEGVSLAREAIASGLAFRLVVSEGQERRDDVKEIIRQAEDMGVEVVVLSDSLMGTVSSLTTSPGVMAVVRMPDWSEREVLARSRPVILLSGLQDPGNVGTIIRTAEAAGAGGIFCTPGTVDPYNPKVVRGSMGSILRMPVIDVDDPLALLKRAIASGYNVLATTAKANETCFETNLKAPFLILIGQESTGVPDDLLAVSNRKLSIPMEGQVESLNAAVATALILFEAKRQREAAG